METSSRQFGKKMEARTRKTSKIFISYYISENGSQIVSKDKRATRARVHLCTGKRLLKISRYVTRMSAEEAKEI